MQTNFNSEYNNSSVNQIVTAIEDTTLEVCDNIFERLEVFYEERNNYECRDIAKLFYRALREYVNPPFIPQFIQRAQIKLQNQIPNINENQVIIIQMASVMAEYHFIVACKSGQNQYKIYSAFGAHFIEPFTVPADNFIQSCTRLVLAESNRDFNPVLGEIEFVQDWNLIINHPFGEYFQDKLDESNQNFELQDQENTPEEFWEYIFRLYQKLSEDQATPVCILTRQ
jgi:hypothetical protein